MGRSFHNARFRLGLRVWANDRGRVAADGARPMRRDLRAVGTPIHAALTCRAIWPRRTQLNALLSTKPNQGYMLGELTKDSLNPSFEETC